MMTEAERSIVERELKEAEHRGYQKALLELQFYLNNCKDGYVANHFEGLVEQFKWGVVEGLDIARAWAINKVDI